MVPVTVERVHNRITDRDGTIGEEKLRRQCDRYIRKFNLQDSDLIAFSYSDLLLRFGISEKS